MNEFYIDYDAPYVEDHELYHHGRLHMHWGVRNGPPYPLNRQGLAKFKKNISKGADAVKKYMKSKSADIKKKNAERKLAAEIRKKEAAEKRINKKEVQTKDQKDIRSLSDEELRNRYTRLKLESDYKEMLAKMNPEKQSGKDYVKELLKKSGKSAVEQVGPKVATYLAKQTVKKMMNLTDEQYKEMFPKKK